VCGCHAPPRAVSSTWRWLEQHDLAPRLLSDDDGRPVAVWVEIAGDRPGPLLCLDACIDTAPAGDPALWSEPPFSATVQRHRLLGRGAADSKSGVAILAHVARTFAASGLPRGTLHVLFDADEHTGRFGGARAYLAANARPPDAVSLGYPGNDCIVVGSRGFLRARVEFQGRAAHSGEIARTGVNAVTKAADFALVRNLAVEWGPRNVRVNAIAPGIVKTDFARALWENEELMKRRNAATPLRRIAAPEEIGPVAAFLASPAASFITGQIIVADGGVTISS